MKKTFTVIALVLLAVSCNRYLDIKPYGQTIPETAEEFSALLHAHLDEIDYGEGFESYHPHNPYNKFQKTNN